MSHENERSKDEVGDGSVEVVLPQIEVRDDDTLEDRLQALVVEHARERAAMAEQITRLRQENQRLLSVQPNAWQRERSRCYHLRVVPQSDLD